MSSLTDELPMAQDAELRARFASLLERYGPGLRRVARAHAPHAAQSEDLWQEIALAIWRALPSFRGECSERTFAFRVAHNRGLTFAARERRPEANRERDEAAQHDAPSDAPSPEERLSDERRRDALFAAIHTLAPGARACVTLALEGLSHDEIAEVLGITANAVGVRLSRARDQLKRALAGES